MLRHFDLATKIPPRTLAGKRLWGIPIFFVCIAVFSLPAFSAQNSAVEGVVRNASGAPVAGAFVKVTSADTGLTVMAISREKGRYSTPRLLPGKYSVQGVGGGFQSDVRGPAEVGSGNHPKIDLVLNAPQKVYPQPKKFSEEELEKLLPEGEAKKILLTKCVICHTPINYVGRRQTREKWANSIDSMRMYLSENRDRQLEFNARKGIDAGPLTNHERDVIVEYLAKNYGPDVPPLLEPPPADPNRHLPRTFLNGAEAKYVALELNIPNSVQVGHYVIDPQGTVWVSEKTTGILGRLDPKTLQYTRVATPPGNTPKDIFATVALDPQGQVWFTSNDGPHSQWLRYDPKANRVVESYDVPVAQIPGGDIYYNSLRFAADGSMWATSTAKQRIVKLDPGTRKVTEYPVRMGQHPFGMAVAGDGMIWFAGDEDNTIIRVETATGKMTPFQLPTPKSRPRRLAVDADGNLWANTLSEGRLVKLEYRTGKMTEFVPPNKGAGQGIDVDKKRNLIWFSEWEGIKIGRFDPRTNTFAEFPLANADEQPWIVQIDPTNQNRVWWNSRNGKIGYVQLID